MHTMKGVHACVRSIRLGGGGGRKKKKINRLFIRIHLSQIFGKRSFSDKSRMDESARSIVRAPCLRCIVRDRWYFCPSVDRNGRRRKRARFLADEIISGGKNMIHATSPIRIDEEPSFQNRTRFSSFINVSPRLEGIILRNRRRIPYFSRSFFRFFFSRSRIFGARTGKNSGKKFSKQIRD